MAYNSRIQPKKRQLSCGCFDFSFSRDRCKKHASLEDGKPLKRTTITKKPVDLKLVDPQEKLQQDQWFMERGKELTGRCLICGGKTCAGTKDYKRSVAHILPKRKTMFPSVATHPLNYIELCFWGKSCHTNFDNNMLSLDTIKAQYPKAWAVIVSRFKAMYPGIAESEKRNIPELLLQEL